MSDVDAAAFNLSGVKILLVDSWSTFFIHNKPVFSNVTRSLSRSSPDCIILDNWVFYVILADELFAKALQIFASCHLLIMIYLENQLHQ